MSLKKAQKEVHAWASQYEVPYWKPHEILARLTEECGEVAREINHLFGPKKKKKGEKKGSLQEEVGDVLFTIICLANSQKISLDDAFAQALAKCYGRDAKRFKRKKE
jgi:NTP pyrophosphatase (non-canonical NTP hydrolase)